MTLRLQHKPDMPAWGETLNPQQRQQLVFTNKDAQLEITKDEKDFLERIKRPVAVVAMIGQAHRGKSWLLNKKSYNNGTRGIWVSDLPSIGNESQKTDILVFDCQPLDYKERKKCYMFLCILTSCMLIYNLQDPISYAAVLGLFCWPC